MPVRILLADDHALVRAGVRALLDGLHDIVVVAEAANGREALASAVALQPDVALMDIDMPELNGVEATARLKRESPRTRVIMLSMYDSDEYVWQALRAGAVGYLLKDSLPAELDIAIRAVSRGERYLSPRVSRFVIEAYVADPGGGLGDGADKLTSRQREVLQLLAEGASTKTIASRLAVSIKTVETHRSDVMRRLDIHDIPGLVRFAVRAGLVSRDK
ncbi:MAG: response regulator transcription factor [Acidobacteriota bacterium]